MKAKPFLYYWLPVFIYAGLIFYLSSLSKPIPDGILIEFSLRDKLLHIAQYFLLSFLLFRLFKFYDVSKAYLYAILIAIAYGITDEFHQIFVLGRVFSLYDVIADTIGASLVLFFKPLNKYFYKNNKSNAKHEKIIPARGK